MSPPAGSCRKTRFSHKNIYDVYIYASEKTFKNSLCFSVCQTGTKKKYAPVCSGASYSYRIWLFNFQEYLFYLQALKFSF